MPNGNATHATEPHLSRQNVKMSARTHNGRPNGRPLTPSARSPAPPTRPDPTRPNKGVEESGEGFGSNAREENPPSEEIPDEWIATPSLARCATHKNTPTPPACGNCKDKRIQAQTIKDKREHAKAEQTRRRREAIDECQDCDDNGMVKIPTGMTRCPHNPQELEYMVQVSQEALDNQEPKHPRARSNWRDRAYGDRVRSISKREAFSKPFITITDEDTA